MPETTASDDPAGVETGGATREADISNPSDCGGESLPAHSFSSSDCGTTVGVAKGDLPIGSQLEINGSANLRGCIVGPGGAYVQKITYEEVGGVRHGKIYAFGRGPSSGGSLTVVFNTANGPHTLSLSGTDPGCFTDRFTDTADITSVTWSSD